MSDAVISSPADGDEGRPLCDEAGIRHQLKQTEILEVLFRAVEGFLEVKSLRCSQRGASGRGVCEDTKSVLCLRLCVSSSFLHLAAWLSR